MASATTPAAREEALAELRARYRDVRRRSDWLAEPLSPEDCLVQSMPDVSPTKWHLAHTTWFFETLVLKASAADYREFHPAFQVLYNSYYNSIGAQHPRPKRGLLSRPSLDEVRAYRAHVDEAMDRLFANPGRVDDALRHVVDVGLHHEQQHQELMVTDVKHVLAQNPLDPVYRRLEAPPRTQPVAHGWMTVAGGVESIGHDGVGFAYDNEGPRHRVVIEPFAIGTRLVTNAEFAAFIEDGGYERPEFWLSDGWATVEAEKWRAPLYWAEKDGTWTEFTLGGRRPLAGDAPVCHVSLYEADAYARWRGCRLPTEAEWEVAARNAPCAGNFVENGYLHPAPAQGGEGTHQFFGDVWEWTQSGYSPYPGYRPPEGPLGEYNSKFMCSQLVLRGGSCATPESHIRATYRNFFPPHARWQFMGIRLAKDLDG